jgi:pentatricopeptide repeat protein
MMATAMPLDDPTRWLDAILLNMKSRKVPLTPQLASQMLWCYSSGYTGKATHHFYRVKRRPLPGAVVVSADESPDDNVETAHSCYASTGSTPGFTTEMPVRRYWDRENRIFERRYTKVHLEHNSCSPPFYKVPSLVGRQSLQYQAKSQHVPQELDRSANNPFPSDHRGLTKLDMEQDPGYSPALNAAFEFASSVRLGAAGHPGVDLNPSGLAALVSACVTRGALWRALQIVEDHEKEPRRGSTVSVVSYNILLTGLARVGDVRTMQDVTGRMLSSGLKPNSSTVRAIVTGLLNLGDVGSAITVVQDSFNQHGVLPPVTTLVTIVEHCLSRDMVFEAKRCVYFVQQLWKWTQTTYDTPEMARFMGRIQSHPQLQRSAIESLFAYFGYRLDDSDFF